MKARAVERTAWSCGLALTILGGWQYGRSSVPEDITPRLSASTPVESLRAPAESLGKWASATVDRDPFRLDRRPAAVRFGAAVLPQETQRPRPSLALLATIGGPPWQALVTGLPGTQGSTVVRLGENVSGFVVRHIGRDTVIIEGMDTTWTLVESRP